MRAIRVRKRGNGGYIVHWLLDAERTYCGKKPAELDVEAELELERLPGLEACLGCERALVGWPRAEREPGELRVVAPSRSGTLRTTGPLYHGTGRTRGRRIR
jgi:hypothetical protein